MTGASAHTAAGGCLTDRTTMPALTMPYNGGRVDSAPRTFSPDEGLREMAPAKLSEQRWNSQGVDTERPLRRQRLDAGKYPLLRTAANFARLLNKRGGASRHLGFLLAGAQDWRGACASPQKAIARKSRLRSLSPATRRTCRDPPWAL
jgi:hypothetical protein